MSGSGWLDAVPLAHRGLHGGDFGEENSLESFESAAARGYGIELDVHLTLDGVPVVSHDDIVATPGGSADIAALRFADIRRLGFPSLDQALDVVGARVPVLIEIKPGRDVKRRCERTAEVVDGYHGQFAVQSFAPAIVLWFRVYRSDWLRGQLLEIPDGTSLRGAVAQAGGAAHLLRSRPHFAAVNYVSRNAVLLKLWRSWSSAPVICWTVDDLETYTRCRDEGRNSIFEGFLPPLTPKA